MPALQESSLAGLPAEIQKLLTDLVEAARASFQDDLTSVVLFGGGAEGRLRATSDLNLLFILGRFEKKRVDAFREPFRAAHLTARASILFVLESELSHVAESFALKFDDIARRRRILFGTDPIQNLTISREAKRGRLLQILTNLTLRLRERYALVSLREEQLALVIAETAGPLRSAAATLLELEGHPAPSPKEALERIVTSCERAEWKTLLEQMSNSRESLSLQPGTAAPLVFNLMELAETLRQRVERAG